MARSQSAETPLSLVLLVVVAGTAIGVDRLAESRRVADRIASWDLKRFVNNEELYMNRGNFLEFEDRLLVDEIPRADYSRGGVYFFGSSDLKWALKTWELPPEERALISNYGVGAISHSLELQFVRYLVEERGLLQAGGDRTHIVLGASWSNALDWSPEAYFGPIWRRHNLYTYSLEDGIHPAAMNRLQRYIRLKKARCSGFVSGNFNRLARLIVTKLGQPLEETEDLKDPRAIQEWVRAHYGHLTWQTSLAAQMEALGRLVDYLHARGVGVTIVLLPHRKAFEDLPLTAAYRTQVATLCEARSVRLVDMSRSLSEDEFWDINHVNYRGLSKTNAVLLGIARDHLRRVGLLPPAGAAEASPPVDAGG